jgi:hypothetical protein
MPFPRKCPNCGEKLTEPGSLVIFGTAQSLDGLINPEFDLLDEQGSPDWLEVEFLTVSQYQCAVCHYEISLLEQDDDER